MIVVPKRLNVLTGQQSFSSSSSSTSAFESVSASKLNPFVYHAYFDLSPRMSPRFPEKRRDSFESRLMY